MSRVETFSLGIEPLGESPRTIYVYLPDAYETSEKPLPVLYMFDGHNLFDDRTATYGKSWGIREYLDRSGLPLVVIGQDCNHTGNERLSEYCPVEVKDSLWFPDIPTSGKFTAEWFARVLKKECEKRYRICRDRKHVGIGGSSMGGLMALYCVVKYNSVFARAACVSPSVDLNMDELTELIRDSDMKKDTKIYLDFGSEETREKSHLVRRISSLLQLSHACTEKGCSTYPNIVVGGMHNEASWETIVPVFIPYLFE